MKQILRIILLLFCMSLHAQKNENRKLLPKGENEMLSANETLRFNGKFESLNPQVLQQISAIHLAKGKTLLLVTDTAHHYFLVDTSILTSEFEKIYFYKTIINKKLTIQIEHGLPANTAWVISDITSDVTGAAIALFLTDTKHISSKMSATEKTIWLSNN